MNAVNNFIQKLKDEGFPHIYTWNDKPGTEYPAHAHKGKVAFYITQGNITMNFKGKHVALNKGERFDVSPSIPHTAKVGPEGCSYVVGEEIKGDS